MNRELSILAIVIVCFAIPHEVLAADVVINEFLANPSGDTSEGSEWIELYNTTDSSIDITGWQLDDIEGGGSDPYIFPSGSIVETKGFFTVEKTTTHITLNNSFDTVRLVHTGGEIMDIVSYEDTQEDVSYGRVGDNGAEWTIYITPSRNAPNVNGITVPSPTPTVTPTTEPSKTPTPSRTPTPSKTPTPLKLPTTRPPSPTKVFSPTSVITKPMLTVMKRQVKIPTRSVTRAVLAEKSINTSTPQPTSIKPTTVKISGVSQNNFGLILIGVGGVFLSACGILAFYTRRKYS